MDIEKKTAKPLKPTNKFDCISLWNERIALNANKKLSPPLNEMTSSYWKALKSSDKVLNKPDVTCFKFIIGIIDSVVRPIFKTQSDRIVKPESDKSKDLFQEFAASLLQDEKNQIDDFLIACEYHNGEKLNVAFVKRIDNKFGEFTNESRMCWSDFFSREPMSRKNYACMIDDQEGRVCSFDKESDSKYIKDTIDVMELYLNWNISTPKISVMLNLKIRRVRQVIEEFRSGKFRRKIYRDPPEGNRRNLKYSKDLDKYIFTQVKNAEGNITIKELRQNYIIFRPGSDTPSYQTFQKRMKKLGLTRKLSQYIPVNRNTKVNKDKRKIFICRLALNHKADSLLIAIDETSLNAEASQRLHWALKGEVWQFQKLKPKITNLTCIIAVSQEGVLQAMFLEGGCDAVIFCHFMNCLFLAIQQSSNERIKKRKLVIIMDNACQHHCMPVIELIRYYKAETLFTAPYSPFHNPCEYVNQALKEHLSRRDIPQ